MCPVVSCHSLILKPSQDDVPNAEQVNQNTSRCRSKYNRIHVSTACLEGARPQGGIPMEQRMMDGAQRGGGGLWTESRPTCGGAPRGHAAAEVGGSIRIASVSGLPSSYLKARNSAPSWREKEAVPGDQ
ncbi:hypothetical protein SKAU_G00112670 [Synaphobranchus kaupii]|uniref:Uncharacterized protein n=1 Tax=Synaphobranchus kaupii TaxID=118154 RepID=A0A9Q1J884_SYNKA|nr:hypothetical protein SKAU_G00112670 [Synaphobranchus kaupii]